MTSKDQKGFFASIASGFSNFGSAVQKSVNGWADSSLSLALSKLQNFLSGVHFLSTGKDNGVSTSFHNEIGTEHVLCYSALRLLGYEGLEVINPEGGEEDAEEEAQKGRWKQEERDGYWKMMHKYIGSDVTSMVTLPVIIFEPMTMIQKMAELMEYCSLLDQADECEDPYMRLVYACKRPLSIFFFLPFLRISFVSTFLKPLTIFFSIMGNFCILCISANLEAF
ncbi:hypothetical protein EJ110_NYTH49747 [Nymphaea thermarum]|nr:hypothetical protein EJ110_NYTH49747 [Nymphaea thermarum]